MFCKKCQPKIKKFLSTLDDKIINNVKISIEVVDKIKAVLNSPFVTTILDLTPTKMDNEIRQKILQVLDSYRIASGVVLDYNGSNSAEIIYHLLKYLQSLQPMKQAEAYFKIASLVSAELDDRRYPQYFYDTATQISYALTKS